MKIFSVVLFTCIASISHGQSYPEAKSIVSVGGPVTEIIYALGEENRIVARDTTSQYPAAALKLPDVGYMRRLSAEGVLSVAPDLIIARETSGPLEAIEQLRSASIPIVFTKESFDADSVISSIHTVGKALGVSEKSDILADQVQSDLTALAQDVAQLERRKRVMFILSNRDGRLNITGNGTGAHGIIELAGGINAMGDAYQGYKLANSEAIIAAAPDVIVMMRHSGDHSATKEELFAIPEISQTPAAQNDAFISIPGAALGFGPRTAELARAFHNALYEK